MVRIIMNVHMRLYLNVSPEISLVCNIKLYYQIIFVTTSWNTFQIGLIIKFLNRKYYIIMHTLPRLVHRVSLRNNVLRGRYFRSLERVKEEGELYTPRHPHNPLTKKRKRQEWEEYVDYADNKLFPYRLYMMLQFQERKKKL